MNLSQKISFQTPAKINFFLFIQGKHKDGYHELLMDMLPISLFDQIELTPNTGRGFQLKSNLGNISDEENIITKAVRLLETTCSESFSLKLKLTKNIPSGAGLGGGSGNAAGILVTFNQAFKLGLGTQELNKLALVLGADVPFFIDPKPVHAKGIGEVLSPLAHIKPLPILLLYPGFPISTIEAYKQCHISQRQLGFWNYQRDHINDHHCKLNDFWEHLSQKFPVLKTHIKYLQNSGASITGMSGSGSTLYGVYNSFKARDHAYINLKQSNEFSLYPVETLNSYSYL